MCSGGGIWVARPPFAHHRDHSRGWRSVATERLVCDRRAPRRSRNGADYVAVRPSRVEHALQTAPAIGRRSNGPSRLAVDLEPVRVAMSELLEIRFSSFGQRDTESVGGDSETPERIAELLDEPFMCGFASLVNSLSHEAEHLARLLGQPRRRVD